MSGDGQKGYLPYIDGLRGLAVLIILLFHLDISFFKGGFVGVDVFFVISGYLITGIIARSIADGTFSFADFYARRVRRIFPALFVMLLFASIGAVLFLGLSQFGDFFKALRYASGQLSNFYYSGEVDYFAASHTHSPLLHTWSLGVEEQFYALWPLLLVGIARVWTLRRAPWILGFVFLVSLGTSEYLAHTDAMQAFYMLHSRAWQLALGGLLALNLLPPSRNTVASGVIGFAGIALILGSAVFLDNAGMPGAKALVPCAGAAMILYAGQGMAGTVLSFRPLVWTGLISYSLYLWHWPLIAFYKNYFETDMGAGVKAAMFLASFVTAGLSYKFVEQPFRRHRFKSMNTIVAGLLVVLAFIVAANILKKSSDASWRVTYTPEEFVRKPHALDRICSVEGGAYDAERCIIGPNKDTYEVILSGDSHASHYALMVMAWAKERGLTVRLFTRGACPAWRDDTEPRIHNGKIDEYCNQLTKDFYQTLKDDDHIRYIFLGLNGPVADDVTRASLIRIKAINPNVFYLGAAPRFEENPHECHIKNNLLVSRWLPRGGQDCLAFDRDFVRKKLAQSVNFGKMATSLGIPYFDPVPFLDEPRDAEGRFMYMDEGHLNRYGSAHLVPAFTDFMQKQGAKAPARR